MTTLEIKKIVRENHWVADRVKALKSEGIEVGVFPMGPGGVCRERKMKDGSIRVQISYGWSTYNYAYCAILR